MPAVEVRRPRRRSLAPVLGMAIALLCLGSVARAQIHQTIALEAADISIDSPWPSNLLPGWFPLDIQATSRWGKPVTLSFEVNEAFTSTSTSSGEIRLEPGETRAVHWLVPVRSDNVRTEFRLIVRTSNSESGYVGLQSPRSATSLDDTYTLFSSAPLGLSSWSSSGSMITHDQLSDDWRAYTSLGRLVLVTTDGLPRAEALEAIRSWVAAGGVLQVVGPADGLGFPQDPRFDRLAERLDAWAEGEPLEERELLPRDLVSEQRYGFGTVQVARFPRTDLTPNWGDGLDPRRTLPQHESGVFPGILSSLWTPIPGLSALPVGWLTAILVVFYLVMGPLQFTWLRRRRAPPSRLLITTPVLGLGFAGLLLVTSLLAQGLGVKQSVSSVTWLDQQRHHVSVLAKRTVYSGSVFDSALRFGAGSAVCSLSTLQHGQAYRVDMDTQTLSGGFLPVRTPTDELLLRSTTARQRVAIEVEDGVPHAVSAFETDLDDFWYRDGSGDYFHADIVPPGERVALTAVTRPFKGAGFLNRMAGSTLEDETFLTIETVHSAPDQAGWLQRDLLPAELPVRCYVALMEESPFLDDGGVPRDTLMARHVLLGVLEPAP